MLPAQGSKYESAAFGQTCIHSAFSLINCKLTYAYWKNKLQSFTVRHPLYQFDFHNTCKCSWVQIGACYHLVPGNIWDGVLGLGWVLFLKACSWVYDVTLAEAQVLGKHLTWCRLVLHSHLCASGLMCYKSREACSLRNVALFKKAHPGDHTARV